jgi:hypothetical protein
MRFQMVLGQRRRDVAERSDPARPVAALAARRIASSVITTTTLSRPSNATTCFSLAACELRASREMTVPAPRAVSIAQFPDRLPRSYVRPAIAHRQDRRPLCSLHHSVVDRLGSSAGESARLDRDKAKIHAGSLDRRLDGSKARTGGGRGF